MKTGNGFRQGGNIFYQSMQKKDMVDIVAILVLLIGSIHWIDIQQIPGTSLSISFKLVEVISVLCAISFLIKSYQAKSWQGFAQKSQYEKILLFLCGAFILFLLVVTGAHFVQQGFNFTFLNYPRISFVLFVVYWLMNSNRFSQRAKCLAGIAFLTGINILEVLWFARNGGLRTSDVLSNINIYTCLALMAIPFLFRLAQKQGWISCLSLVNLGVIATLIPYTGSRIGFALLVVILVCESLLWIKRATKKFYIHLLLALLISTLCIVAIYLNTEYPARSSLLRATGVDRILKIENDDLRFFKAEDASMQMVLANKSDLIRKELWTSAIQDFLKHPLIGTGDWNYHYELSTGIQTQSPHNLILEMLLCYGSIGTLLYGTILVLLLWRLMACGSVIRKHEIIICTAAFGGYSLFQPTFVSYPLIVWFMLLLSVGDVESKDALV